MRDPSQYRLVTDVIVEYLKFFPLSLEYSPRLLASGNIFKYSPHRQ